MRFGLTVAAFAASLLATAPVPAQAASLIPLRSGPIFYYQYDLAINQGIYAPSDYGVQIQTREFSDITADKFFSCTPLCRDWALTDKGDHVELKVGDAVLTFSREIFADDLPGTGSQIPSLPIGNFGSNASGVFYTGVVQIGGVPEPSVWAMMILGFGAIGAAMRRRVRHKFRPA